MHKLLSQFVVNMAFLAIYALLCTFLTAGALRCVQQATCGRATSDVWNGRPTKGEFAAGHGLGPAGLGAGSGAVVWAAATQATL